MGVRWTLLVAVVSTGAAVRAGSAADGTPAGALPTPTTQEHRYRLSAAIRPFLFWVGAKNDAGRSPASAGPLPRSVSYTFNAGVYDLVVSSWERVPRAQYGARNYEKLVRLEFESRNREKGTTERFVLACGTEGPLAGVPVFVRYQPKWWFKVEGVLDEDETL
jgi:hypothetical protein